MRFVMLIVASLLTLIFVAPTKACCQISVTYEIADSSNSKPHYRGSQFHFANAMGEIPYRLKKY